VQTETIQNGISALKYLTLVQNPPPGL